MVERRTETADFQHTREALATRVWRMVEAALEHTSLREELFQLAASPTTCVDSVASTFSTLEVRYLLFEARAKATGKQAAEVLLDFARRLFRLDEVERVARADMTTRGLEGLGVDEVEVSLAYRSGLASPLDLPGQPRTMRFAEVAGVTAAKLSAAAVTVREAEASERLSAFISTQDFWLAHLTAQHTARFSALEQQFWERLERLTAQQGSLSEGDYLDQMGSLASDREAALQALALRLTDAALAAAGTSAGTLR